MLVIPGYRILKVEPAGREKFTEILCEASAGGVREHSDVVYFPGCRSLKIKSVVESGDVFRLRIKGIPRSSLLRGGMIVSAEWPITEVRDALLLPDGKPVPSETETVRGGLLPDFNRERFIGRGRFHQEGSFFSVRFPHPFPLFPAGILSIPGLDGIPRKFTVLYPGKPSKDELRKLNAMARRRPDPHPEESEIFGRILHIRGFVEIPPPLYAHDWKSADRIGSWLILEDRRKILERKILKIVSRPGGADKELLRKADYPEGLILAMVGKMVDKGVLRTRGEWFFPSGEPGLSPYHRSWLKKILDSGEEGVRVRSVTGDSDRSALEVLHRSGLIRGGEELWLSEEAYRSLRSRLIGGRKKGDVISMASARETLGGSRARTLEVLSLMDSEGSFSRSEDGGDRILL